MATLTKDKIFRDSSSGKEQGFAGELIRFCREKSGRKILDYGCAKGDYCAELNRLGFECVGVDINKEYIRSAQEKGVEAFVADGRLPFPDGSFDTVIMFELLEHVNNPDEILREAKRVARKNILLTVPDNTGFYKLRKIRLTFEHMLEKDHVNFFTKDSLSELLSRHFDKYSVEEKEPIFIQGLLPWYLRKPISLFIRLGLIKPLAYFRLYAECYV